MLRAGTKLNEFPIHCMLDSNELKNELELRI